MNDANIARKSATQLLEHSLASVKIEAGFLIKAYRGYKRSGKPDGLRQEDVEKKIGFVQSRLSQLENGKAIPDDATLKKVLSECGFDLLADGGKAFFELLKFIRDNEKGLKALKNEKPN